MANRERVLNLDKQFREFTKKKGVNVDWMMDSGKVVLKKNGDVKLSYSIRDENENEQFKQNLNKFFVVDQKIKCRIRPTNMLNEYRSQILWTVTILAVDVPKELM